MIKSAEQVANIRTNCLELRERKTMLDSLPSHVFVELTRRCNLRCPMCARTAAGMSGAGPDMGWGLFSKVERELFPFAVLVELNGLGESALMPRWHDALGVCAGHSFHPLVVSNGQALDDETIDFFVRREGVLRISVDGASPEVYESWRPGARFDRLVNTLTRIRGRARRDNGNGFALDVVTVFSRRNLGQIEDIVRLASRFGTDTLYLQHLVVLRPENAADSLTHVQVEANEALWRVRVMAGQLKLGLVAPPFFAADGHEALSAYFEGDAKWMSRADRIIMEHRDFAPGNCAEPWNNTVVEHDGAVKPCCVSETVLGNLNESSFRGIWNGPGYQSLRRQILGIEPLSDPSCSRCYAVHPNRAEALLRHGE